MRDLLDRFIEILCINVPLYLLILAIIIIIILAVMNMMKTKYNDDGDNGLNGLKKIIKDLEKERDYYKEGYTNSKRNKEFNQNLNTPPSSNYEESYDNCSSKSSSIRNNEGAQSVISNESDVDFGNVEKREKEESKDGKVSLNKILYAEAYSNSKKTFYDVTTNPSDDTIYTITIDPKNSKLGELDVYPDAIEKIIDCRDYLEFYCDKVGSGNILTVTQKGLVALEDDKWIIKDNQKLVVKFS